MSTDWRARRDTELEQLTEAADRLLVDHTVVHVVGGASSALVATFACGRWVCVSHVDARAPITVGQMKVKVDLDEEDFANQIEAIARNARSRFRAASWRS